MQPQIHHHRSGEENVRNVLISELQLHQLHIATRAKHFSAEDLFAFDSEQNVTICSGYHDHHRDGCARSDRFLIEKDLDSACNVIPDPRGGIRRDPDGRLRGDDVTRSGIRCPCRSTRPAKTIESLLRRSEVHFRLAVRIGRDSALRDPLLDVSPANESPRVSSRLARRREGSSCTDRFELAPTHFFSGRIEPHFLPLLARDLQRSRR